MTTADIAATRAARAETLRMRGYADELAEYTRHRFVVLYADGDGGPGWNVATFHETFADARHDLSTGPLDYIPCVLVDLDTGEEWNIETTARIGARVTLPWSLESPVA